MAFENLTLFELHMEGSRFGPRSGGEEEAAEEYEVEAEAEESGGSRAGPMIGFLLLVVGVALAYRRFRGGAEEAPGEESEQITIEHAAE